jgi:hypothetical protein
MALFAALALLALIGTLVAGAFASAIMLGRSGQMAQTDAALSMAADYALTSVLGEASSLRLADIRFGETVVVPVALPGQSALTARVSVTRLRSGVLWLVADVSAGSNAGKRRVNLVARFAAPPLAADAMIVSAGGVEIGSGVSFEPAFETERDCAVPSGADLALAPTARAFGGSGVRIEVRAAAADSTDYLLDGRTWSTLAATPGVTYKSDNLTISGSPTARVLLVGGRLTIDGPLTFSGLIIARGGIEMRGTGSVIEGIVMSAARDSAAVTFSGVRLRFAPCVALRAVDAAVPLRPVRERSWGELF